MFDKTSPISVDILVFFCPEQGPKIEADVLRVHTYSQTLVNYPTPFPQVNGLDQNQTADGPRLLPLSLRPRKRPRIVLESGYLRPRPIITNFEERKNKVVVSVVE